MEQSRRQVKASAHIMEPCVRIGKKGITDSVISEIGKHLKKKKIVKIKLLSAFLEGKEKSFKKEAAIDIAKRTNSDLISMTGFVVVLRKKPERENKCKEQRQRARSKE